MSEGKNIDIVSICISNAWKGFKGWWIPLCLLSFVLFMSNLLPHYFFSSLSDLDVVKPIKKEYVAFRETVQKNNAMETVNAVEKFQTFLKSYFHRTDVQAQMNELLMRILYLMLGSVLVVGAIHMALVVATRAACNKKEKRATICRHGIQNSPQLYMSYLFLSVLKIIPFFFFILPGIYIYTKLYFTGYVLTEESANPFKAIAKSWKLSEGHFWNIIVIFIITMVADSIAILTIIGIIPATAFKYTLRASLYRLVKEGKQASPLVIPEPNLEQ